MPDNEMWFHKDGAWHLSTTSADATARVGVMSCICGHQVWLQNDPPTQNTRPLKDQRCLRVQRMELPKVTYILQRLEQHMSQVSVAADDHQEAIQDADWSASESTFEEALTEPLVAEAL